jgi:hypothetical protein
MRNIKMKVQRRSWGVYPVIGLLCVLLGLATSMCGSDSEGEGDSTEGRLTLLLVDDPIDTVTSLNVTIESIEVHGNGPPRELTLNPDVDQPVNILELENGVFATLVNGNDNENVLPTGTYGNLKIHITEASITFTEDPEEVPTPATVPPDKFNVGGPFTINEGEVTELYLVFHANNSLHDNGQGEYIVNPSLKLISKTVSGSITGSVFPLPGEEGFTKVKVFANRGDTENEVTTFAETDGSFELVPLREGTHEISAEWITLDGEEVEECRVRVHGDEDVVAEQVTNIGTPITLDGGDPC